MTSPDKNPFGEDFRQWPFGLYFQKCYHCHEPFTGPKRAGICWDCLDTKAQTFYLEQHQARMKLLS